MPEKKTAQSGDEPVQKKGAEDEPKLEEPRPQFTTPEPLGGRFWATDGKTLVNCWNQKIDEEGNVLDPTPLPRGT